eukprot:3058616-Rhodomonas_salina.2
MAQIALKQRVVARDCAAPRQPEMGSELAVGVHAFKVRVHAFKVSLNAIEVSVREKGEVTWAPGLGLEVFEARGKEVAALEGVDGGDALHQRPERAPHLEQDDPDRVDVPLRVVIARVARPGDHLRAQVQHRPDPRCEEPTERQRQHGGARRVS